MKITDEVYIVGSGGNGLGISDDYDCHVYLINAGSELALVDAGVGIDTERILNNIRDEGFDPDHLSTVLLTHAHADHAGGCYDLKSALGVSMALSSEEKHFLETGDEDELGLTFARSAGWYPADYHLRSCAVDIGLSDGQQIAVGNLRIMSIKVPGHSRGSICYLMYGKELIYLFTGDVVFLRGFISLLNAPGSSLEDYRNNIRKLSDLSVDSLLPGHQAFCLKGGQKHIDKAIAAFDDLVVPKCIL